MTSNLHQESGNASFIQKKELFDILFKIMDETDGKININSIPELEMHHNQYKLCIEFLYDLGFLEQNFEIHVSRNSGLRISSKGLKFIKDYKWLKRLFI